MNNVLLILFSLLLLISILTVSYLLLFKRQFLGVISETGISVNPHLISLIKIVLIGSYFVTILSVLALVKTILALLGYEISLRTFLTR